MYLMTNVFSSSKALSVKLKFCSCKLINKQNIDSSESATINKMCCDRKTKEMIDT